MDILVKIVHFLATNIWLAIVIVMVTVSLQIAIPVMNANRDPADKRYKPYKRAGLKFVQTSIVMVILAVGLIYIKDWNNALLYRNGKDGTGVITRIQQTNKMVNTQYVLKYAVLIKTNEGTLIETQFESADFNVYPSRNSIGYPKIGEHFALRYLPSNPKAFVILTNRKSEYADRLACGTALEKVTETRIMYEADSLNIDYRHAYIQALEQLIQADCYKEYALKKQFMEIDQETIKRLKALD